MRDINRTFELTGVAGGKRVFYYDADTVNKVLYLQDKNTAGANRRNSRNSGDKNLRQTVTTASTNGIPATSLANIPNENTRINQLALSTRRTRGIAEEIKKDPKRNKMILKYSTDDGSRVILEGINEKKDSIYMILDRVNKNYALTPSSLQAGQY